MESRCKKEEQNTQKEKLVQARWHGSCILRTFDAEWTTGTNMFRRVQKIKDASESRRQSRNNGKEVTSKVEPICYKQMQQNNLPGLQAGLQIQLQNTRNRVQDFM